MATFTLGGSAADIGVMVDGAHEMLTTATQEMATGEEMTPSGMIKMMAATTAFTLTMDVCSGCMKSVCDGMRAPAQKI